MLNAIEIVSPDGAERFRFIARVDTNYIEVTRFPETREDYATVSNLFGGARREDGRRTFPIQITHGYLRRTLERGQTLHGYTMREFTIQEPER